MRLRHDTVRAVDTDVKFCGCRHEYVSRILPRKMWQRVQKRQQCMCLVFLALLASARCTAPHGRPESVLRMHRGGTHRIIVKYDIDGSAGGLINQLLCHVAAFMLAVSLEYEILLPHALSRSSFNVTWEEQRWQKEPLDTLLNVDSIVRHWRHRGIIVHKVSCS